MKLKISHYGLKLNFSFRALINSDKDVNPVINLSPNEYILLKNSYWSNIIISGEARDTYIHCFQDES